MFGILFLNIAHPVIVLNAYFFLNLFHSGGGHTLHIIRNIGSVDRVLSWFAFDIVENNAISFEGQTSQRQ